jgi:fructose-1,6-bisphosphatase/inositol monophosphatase family enzyme
MRPVSTAFAAWEAPLRRLCDELRATTRAALDAARARGRSADLARPVGQGKGDVTFGLDAPAEAVLDRWLAEQAACGPLSLLTEDSGWRHLGPAGALPGFDHGGPRIAVDPIDGTRNLMAELRPAWTVVSFAGPGPAEPRLSELAGGIIAEIPTRGAALYRVLAAARGGGTRLEERDAATGRPLAQGPLRADGDDRVDHGYFPVFRYKPDLRPAIARLEAALFARLAEREGADPRSVYDDQYISNAGQLALLALGTYRAVFDPRALAAARLGMTTVTSKPYDVAGAILCAEEAGAVVRAADGGALDFPLDAETPVSFAGYANPATRARVEPCWLWALAAELPLR